LNGKYSTKNIEDAVSDVNFGIKFINEHKTKLRVRRRNTT